MSEKTIVAHTDLNPHFYPLHHEVYDLLETRIPHTVATNGLSDVITLFQLNEDDAKTTLLTENLTGGVSGGDISPTPIFSDEWIAYGQTRGFTRYNLRTSEFHDQLVCTILDETVKACRALDPGKNVFVFMVHNMENNEDRWIFKTFNLSTEKPAKVATLEVGKYRGQRGGTIGILDSLLFYYDDKMVLNSVGYELKPVSHPLTKAFNENKGKLVQLSQLCIHPKLPFAIADALLTYIVSWKDNKKDLAPFVFIERDHYVWDFSFSHDGTRLVWKSKRKNSEPEERIKYWVAKVDDSIPGYIGKPQLLGSTYSDNTEPLTTAWAENPNTFVVSEMNGLYWWHVK